MLPTITNHLLSARQFNLSALSKKKKKKIPDPIDAL